MNILLVSYYAPLSRSTGARRAANLSKYLVRSGHRVTIVTSTVSGSPVPLIERVEGADNSRVVAARDLMESRLNWRRRNIQPLLNHGPNAVYDARPSLLLDLFIPDPQLVTWVPAAVKTVKRLHSQSAFDCIVTTAPPQSAHMVGLLTRHLQIPWVADFRDGWNFERLSPVSRIPILARLDHSLEARVMRSADAISAVTEGIAGDVQHRFGRQVEVITNGFDPDESDPVSRVNVESGRAIRFTYTGSIEAGARQNNLLNLLLRAGRNASSILSREGIKIEFIVAGPRTIDEGQQFDLYADIAEHRGVLPRSDSLSLQRDSDVLVVLIGEGNPGVATGKLYEYIAAQRPILVVGTGNAAARVVNHTRTGQAVRADEQALSQVIQNLARNRRYEPDTAAVAEYGWPCLVKRFESLIRRTVAESKLDRRPDRG